LTETETEEDVTEDKKFDKMMIKQIQRDEVERNQDKSEGNGLMMSQ
jgi:hypothetical protein